MHGEVRFTKSTQRSARFGKLFNFGIVHCQNTTDAAPRTRRSDVKASSSASRSRLAAALSSPRLRVAPSSVACSSFFSVTCESTTTTRANHKSILPSESGSTM